MCHFNHSAYAYTDVVQLIIFLKEAATYCFRMQKLEARKCRLLIIILQQLGKSILLSTG